MIDPSADSRRVRKYMHEVLVKLAQEKGVFR